jgi:hypothetical protein
MKRNSSSSPLGMRMSRPRPIARAIDRCVGKLRKRIAAPAVIVVPVGQQIRARLRSRPCAGQLRAHRGSERFQYTPVSISVGSSAVEPPCVDVAHR